jgi:hypothetical protein
MKMLVLIYSGATPDRVTNLLDGLPVEGYTELDRAHGVGRTGRRLGTRAWPGESTVVFTMVQDEDAGPIAAAVRAEAAALPDGERLHLAVLPMDAAV